MPAAAGAQHSSWLLPSRELLPTLLAGVRDPVTQAKFVLTAQSPNRFDAGFEAEVSVGASLPVLLLAGATKRDALVAGIEAAVFGRFSLTTLERDAISTDWVVLVPLVWHRGEHWFRLSYHHFSSHLGDDYGKRFGVEAINYGRDAADAMAFVRLHPEFGVYGGMNWAYNVYPNDAGRWTVRLGAELERHEPDGIFTPYGAVDVQMDQNTSWTPRVNVRVGARLPPLDGRRIVRLGAEFLSGPSPQGQFYDQQTAQWAVGIWVDL
jgi:hypothetical protein